MAKAKAKANDPNSKHLVGLLATISYAFKSGFFRLQWIFRLSFLALAFSRAFSFHKVKWLTSAAIAPPSCLSRYASHNGPSVSDGRFILQPS